MALGFADKLAREFHGLCLLPDCIQQAAQRKWPESLTATANDQIRWFDTMSAWNKVLALVLILNLTMPMKPIDLARTAAGFAAEIRIQLANRATDIWGR